MSDTGPRISDERARELWQRAAELHAAAERRRQEQTALVRNEPHGLSLEQVATAAEGAGIDPDYVRMTVAEQQLPDGDRIDPNLWTARWVRGILREPDAIEVNRSIAARPADVLTALKSVAAKPEFELIQEAQVGDDPVSDAVLVYRLPKKSEVSFHSNLDWTDVRVLLFAVRAEGEGTRVHVRMPLFRRGARCWGVPRFVSLGLSGWQDQCAAFVAGAGS